MTPAAQRKPATTTIPFALFCLSWQQSLHRQGVREMAVLIHERPDGELVVSECDWQDGVQSFERILTTYYGDSPKSVWDTSNQEERGLRSAVGSAGDVVVLSSSRLQIGRDGITVVPDDGVPWLLVRRDGSPPARVSHRQPVGRRGIDQLSDQRVREKRMAWHTLSAALVGRSDLCSHAMTRLRHGTPWPQTRAAR